jgi:hypothetical protein
MDEKSMGTFLLVSGKIALVAIQPVMITLLLAALIGPISSAAGCSPPAPWRRNSAG